MIGWYSGIDNAERQISHNFNGFSDKVCKKYYKHNLFIRFSKTKHVSLCMFYSILFSIISL